MADNIDITVNETIDNIVINSAISTDVIDFNLYATTETINIDVTPELTTVNINSISGGGLVTSVNGEIGDIIISAPSVNDATTSVKGIVKLAGDLAGTADFPTVPNKVDKVTGKGLSANDFTNTLKTKLDGIADGAEVNINADWNATSGDAQILNKPTIPSIAGLATTSYVDAADALKVDKITGKGLSTNDYTTAEQTKVSNLSGTNSGDNATNTQYSGLSTSKQDTLTAANTHTFVDTLISLTTPADADKMIIVDNSLSLAKKITWLNVKATLKTYFDSIYTTTSLVATQITTALTNYATQTFVNTGLGLKEDSSNKSTLTTDSASTTKFPVWSAILSYFDAARIRTLLGITTLSGSNTGDQDLSGYVPTSRTINGKALSANVSTRIISATDSSALTGTGVETILKSIIIPANFFAASDIMTLDGLDMIATGVLGSKNLRFYVNTSVAIPATLIAQMNNVATSVYAGNITRKWIIKGGNIEFPTPGNITTPSNSVTSSSSSRVTLAFDVTVQNYLIITGLIGNNADSMFITGGRIS